MEKIRSQIMLDAEDQDFLNRVCIENRLRNTSEAVRELIKQHKRFEYIVKQLEKRAQDAEIWRERANRRSEQCNISTENVNIADTE